MKIAPMIFVTVTLLAAEILLFGQSSENCFLEDFQPKNAIIPPYQDLDKPSASPTVTVTINTADTLGKVSKYIFGNALAAWLGNDVYNPVLIGHLQKLAPTLIRYPGGSWADIFFWNGDPGDLPSTIPDGTNNGAPIPLNPQFGKNSWPTTLDNYYDVCRDVNTPGLITINYGYARYGLSENPVAQAAHLAAEWVRYDNGRTKFWEIGNENAGPWEAGWQIDTAMNQDGQPEIITGELYGQHFNIIADSMRAAAAELENTIYIGGQILHYDGTNSWNIADRQWNEGFFREVGDNADFYVIHNYFGEVRDVGHILNIASTLPKEMIDFIHQDIAEKQAALKPVALTEWNITGWSGWETARSSFINGMQSVIVFCELIKLNYGMSCRWLIANWESDGMFYRGDNSNIPDWNPRPAFFYSYYLQKFTGDHALPANSDNNGFVAYASSFSSGETGVVIVNKTTAAQVVRLLLPGKGVGDYYYAYSLTGGSDGQYSQVVYVNEYRPTAPAWGPLEDLENLPAWRYTFDGEIKFNSPGRSVQFILIEPGDNPLSLDTDLQGGFVSQFNLSQNYPNPFNPRTTIGYALPQTSIVSLKIYDVMGREISAPVSGEKQAAGRHQVLFDASNLSSGVYFYKLVTENFSDTRKMLLIR